MKTYVRKATLYSILNIPSFINNIKLIFILKKVFIQSFSCNKSKTFSNFKFIKEPDNVYIIDGLLNEVIIDCLVDSTTKPNINWIMNSNNLFEHQVYNIKNEEFKR